MGGATYRSSLQRHDDCSTSTPCGGSTLTVETLKYTYFSPGGMGPHLSEWELKLQVQG